MDTKMENTIGKLLFRMYRDSGFWLLNLVLKTTGPVRFRVRDFRRLSRVILVLMVCRALFLSFRARLTAIAFLKPIFQFLCKKLFGRNSLNKKVETTLAMDRE